MNGRHSKKPERWLWILVCCGALWGAEELTILRGKPHRQGSETLLEASNGNRYGVSGDAALLAQLADRRLAGRELEAHGKLKAPNHLEIIRLFTLKEGKRHRITYWCDICSSRLNRPGPCPNGHDVPAEPELQEIPD
jgi:hypothetical protein